jgi:SAM-dependent methyltransferase
VTRHEPLPVTTRAFDRLAAGYDALSAGELFRLMRERTHHAFARCFDSSSRILEIGCGTGADTEFLARRCREVIACDPSEEMVTRALSRLAHSHLDARVTIMPCGLQDLQTYLDALAPHEPFDGIVSNFGALNCVPHLAPLGAILRQHLRPGGVALLGVMTRLCAFEAVYFALTRRARLAVRRLGNGAIRVPVAGLQVPTYYHRVGELRSAAGNALRLTRVEGIAVMIPPPYLEARWQSVPRALRVTMARVDGLVSGLPLLNRVGDHVLLQFVKESR